MESVNNSVKKYINQYYDIADGGDSACNVSVIAMITGDDPINIRTYIRQTWGSSQDEDNLILYLTASDYNTIAVTSLAYSGNGYNTGRAITNHELKTMRDELKKGHLILYHKYGHYQLMRGYNQTSPAMCEYIFNDPAGDRKIQFASRARESGENVIYSSQQLIDERIYGRCWAVWKEHV